MALTGDLLYNYFSRLNPEIELPDKVSFINPYSNKDVKSILRKFCNSYYKDTNQRVLILGINPGRFGAGITGIPFTDPVALDNFCRIPNLYDKKRELSSRFVYDFISDYGGVKKFYHNFLLAATCPLGFLHGIKNYNYYDSPTLLNATDDFIKEALIRFSKMNTSQKVVISLGKKNATHLEKFNNELQLFEKIVTLDHPRFILQYKRNEMADYIRQYVKVLEKYS